MAVLHPTSDFNWQKIAWGAPDETMTELCSYCDAPLGDVDEPDYEIPLIMWNKEGWCAQFCIECQRRYWGLV